MIRKLLIPSLATTLTAALLGGCVSGYQYRDGAGDYYYSQPQVEYRDYGYGGYGEGPYGYGGGWGGQIGYGAGGYGSAYGYGGYSGYGGYGYPYYPGGRVIIVHPGDHDHDNDDSDHDADDSGGPTPGTHRPRWGGDLGGIRPSLPASGHWITPPHSGPLPSGSMPSGVMRTRPMPTGDMQPMPRVGQPRGEQIRHRNQDHDGGRILTP